MERTYHDDMKLFRELSRQASIEERAEQLLKLLVWLGKTDSMQLAIRYFEWYLPRFKEHFPLETWVEKRFEEVKKAVLLDHLNADWPIIFPEYYNKNSDVNIRNIQYGIMYSMWSMVKSIDNPKRCIEYTRDVLLEILTMVRMEYAGGVPPEFLQKGEGADLKDFVDSLWLALAKKIEVLLITKYSPD